MVIAATAVVMYLNLMNKDLAGFTYQIIPLTLPLYSKYFVYCSLFALPSDAVLDKLHEKVGHHYPHICLYRSLMKEPSWVEHLTSLPKGGMLF